MGHSKIHSTFDTYGHLLAGSRDEVRERMDVYVGRPLSTPRLSRWVCRATALHGKQWFAEAARFVRLWLSDNHNREHDCDKRNAHQHQCSTKRVVERTPAVRLAYRNPVQTGSSELIK